MLNITIEQLNSITASEALQAMVDGTRDNAADPLFRIEMRTYGKKNDEGICFGCAATCAIAALNKELYSETTKDLKPGRLYRFVFSPENTVESSAFYQRLGKFEATMNSARVGDVHKLLDFVGVKLENRHLYDDRFRLSNSNWREELPKVEALIDELIAVGL